MFNKKHDNTPSQMTQPVLRRQSRHTVQFDTTDEYHERVRRASVAPTQRLSESGEQRRRSEPLRRSHAQIQIWAVGMLCLGPNFETMMGSDYVMGYSEDEAYEAALETALNVFPEAKGCTCHHVELTVVEHIHIMQVVESARG